MFQYYKCLMNIFVKEKGDIFIIIPQWFLSSLLDKNL